MSDLPPRERTLVTLAVLLAVGCRDEADRLIRRTLKREIVSIKDASETILHLALLLGVPSTLDALERLSHSAGAIPLTFFKPSHVRGKKTFLAVYGEQAPIVLKRLKAVSSFLPQWILRDVYGTVFSRPGLDFRTRELVTMTVLATQGLHKQFLSHVRGAHRANIAESEILHWIAVAQNISGRDLAYAKTIAARFLHGTS
ncbi:MAG: hypothetical protein A3H45_07325 [Ignavibacteria bacterium RIFCSPLOWO2_02_FULL_55_14]|nr:MAG: hypothetical protein A3H45_07325 [Ignavibacteria bacterium RIFCSPLOWO2_02_FULL_55_14]OGU73454.1 MAG: hypothetical protein A3G43_05230 [Ignavibacteria bacterium RIFCSPLOWO2_12_FULL_56_21]